MLDPFSDAAFNSAPNINPSTILNPEHSFNTYNHVNYNVHVDNKISTNIPSGYLPCHNYNNYKINKNQNKLALEHQYYDGKFPRIDREKQKQKEKEKQKIKEFVKPRIIANRDFTRSGSKLPQLIKNVEFQQVGQTVGREQNIGRNRDNNNNNNDNKDNKSNNLSNPLTHVLVDRHIPSHFRQKNHLKTRQKSEGDDFATEIQKKIKNLLQAQNKNANTDIKNVGSQKQKQCTSSNDNDGDGDYDIDFEKQISKNRQLIKRQRIRRERQMQNQSAFEQKSQNLITMNDINTNHIQQNRKQSTNTNTNININTKLSQNDLSSLNNHRQKYSHNAIYQKRIKDYRQQSVGNKILAKKKQMIITQQKQQQQIQKEKQQQQNQLQKAQKQIQCQFNSNQQKQYRRQNNFKSQFRNKKPLQINQQIGQVKQFIEIKQYNSVKNRVVNNNNVNVKITNRKISKKMIINPTESHQNIKNHNNTIKNEQLFDNIHQLLLNPTKKLKNQLKKQTNNNVHIKNSNVGLIKITKTRQQLQMHLKQIQQKLLAQRKQDLDILQKIEIKNKQKYENNDSKIQIHNKMDINQNKQSYSQMATAAATTQQTISTPSILTNTKTIDIRNNNSIHNNINIDREIQKIQDYYQRSQRSLQKYIENQRNIIDLSIFKQINNSKYCNIKQKQKNIEKQTGKNQ